MATTIWNIDPAHTSVEFAVKHMMLTTVRGHFKDVSGTITVDDDNPGRSKIEVEIGAASLDTGVADRDTHLKSADFLDAEKHSKITFRSTREKALPVISHALRMSSILASDFTSRSSPSTRARR